MTPSNRSSAPRPDDESARFPSWAIPAVIVLALLGGAGLLGAYAASSDRALASRLNDGVAIAQQAVTQWEREELSRAETWASDAALAGTPTAIPGPLAAFARNAAATDGVRAAALFTPQGALIESTAPMLISDAALGQRVAAVQRARSGTASVAGPVWPASTRDGGTGSEWLLISAAPVRDANGSVSAVLAFFYDPDAPLHRMRYALRQQSGSDVYLMDESGAVLSTLGGDTRGLVQGPSGALPDGSATPPGRSERGVAVSGYAGPTGAKVAGAWAPAQPLALRVVYEISARAAHGGAAVPPRVGYGVAALLVIAAVLVLIQRRGVGELKQTAIGGSAEANVVVEAAPNAVLVVDDKGVIMRANRKATQMLDADASALAGSPIDRWIETGVPFKPERLSSWLEGAAKGAKAHRGDGEHVNVDVRVGSGDAKGKRLYIVVLVDGTTSRGAEKAMKEARDEAEKTRKSQQEFVGLVHNEIRSPMSRVVGMAHLLKDTSLSDVQRGYVESMMRSAQSMMTFVTDVLDLNKIENGSLQLVEAPFDLRVAVSEVAELCEPQATVAQTRIDARITEKTPMWVIGDSSRLRQVLINLVGNGIKFAPGGRVELKIDGARDGTDVKLTVQVKDNGPGMDQESARRLLAKDHTTVSKLAGGGLGVSLSKHIVELMKGKLEVKTLQGEGTTFFFTLVLKATEGAMEAAEPATTRVLAGARAVVVEGSADDAKVTREWLRSWGMRVETMATPEEAISHMRRAAAEGDPIEVALVDRQTMGDHADAFARRMRQEPGIAGVGLLVSTNAAQPGDLEALGSAGCDATLVRPYGALALSRTLAAVVQKPKDERGKGPMIRGETLGAPSPRAAYERADGHIAIVEDTSLRRPSAPEPVEDLRLRVLLAEDNRVNQIIAANLLKSLGCRVEVVNDGAEAVRTAARHEFDVIFMDIQMPHMDGPAATSLIRRLAPPFGRAHIIAMGTSASPDEHDRYLAAGMNDVVVKPLTPESVAAALQRRPAGVERPVATSGAA
ncbi:MAG: response regulator [Gemmatimonadaceae bacterium]